MKFVNYIMVRVTLLLSLVLAVWATLFYYTIVDEINDETDDVLEDYSTMIIQNFLVGESMPTNDNGSNNTYFLRAVSSDSLEVVRRNEGFSNESIFIKYKNEDEPARVLRQLFRDKDDNYYEVTVITPTIDNADLIEAIWSSLAILFALLLIVILIVNVVAVKSGLSPLQRFLSWLHSSDIETCELPSTNKSNIREIKELSAAIEVFAKRGKRAFEQQKEFIGNASHELQTPIAICQNRLELLCESSLTEQQMEDVAECLNTLTRLSRLNKSLLMLSKIENGGFTNETININQIIDHNMSLYEQMYQRRSISYSITKEGECRVEANRDLMMVMVLNLIKNSSSHNIDEGVVNAKITTDSITISNSGEDKSLDSEKIFNRFYQGSGKSGTYGLGLAIVHSICKLYRYEITYKYASGLHQFTILFK